MAYRGFECFAKRRENSISTRFPLRQVPQHHSFLREMESSLQLLLHSLFPSRKEIVNHEPKELVGWFKGKRAVPLEARERHSAAGTQRPFYEVYVQVTDEDEAEQTGAEGGQELRPVLLHLENDVLVPGEVPGDALGRAGRAQRAHGVSSCRATRRRTRPGW